LEFTLFAQNTKKLEYIFQTYKAWCMQYLCLKYQYLQTLIHSQPMDLW